MLDYSSKLTRTPHAIRSEDVERLRGEGFEDGAILDICQIVSYYNYVNRLADGLGIELESSWTEDDMTLTRPDFERLLRERHGEDTPLG